MAGDTRNGIQPSDKEVPAPAVAFHHSGHRILALKRLQRGLHRKVTEAAYGMLIQLLDRIHNFLRPTNIAQPPACHGGRLGKAIDGDHTIRRTGNGRRADALGSVIDNGTVHLVGQDEQIVLHSKIRYVPGLLQREDTAGGVVGIIDDEQPGTGRNRLFQCFPGNMIVLLKIQFHAYRHAACRRHDRCIGNPAGIQDHDLLSFAGIDEGTDGLIDGVFAAGGHQDILCGAGDAPVLPQHLCNAFPQRTDTAGFCIMGMSLGDRTDTGVSRTVRRIEVRLSGGQRDDMLPGSPHGFCPFVDRHRCRRRYGADGLIKQILHRFDPFL